MPKHKKEDGLFGIFAEPPRREPTMEELEELREQSICKRCRKHPCWIRGSNVCWRCREELIETWPKRFMKIYFGETRGRKKGSTVNEDRDRRWCDLARDLQAKGMSQLAASEEIQNREKRRGFHFSVSTIRNVVRKKK